MAADSGDNHSIEDVIFYNELENILESVPTEKEYDSFLLFCNGVSYEKIRNIFGVGE